MFSSISPIAHSCSSDIMRYSYSVNKLRSLLVYETCNNLCILAALSNPQISTHRTKTKTTQQQPAENRMKNPKGARQLEQKSDDGSTVLEPGASSEGSVSLLITCRSVVYSMPSINSSVDRAPSFRRKSRRWPTGRPSEHRLGRYNRVDLATFWKLGLMRGVQKGSSEDCHLWFADALWILHFLAYLRKRAQKGCLLPMLYYVDQTRGSGLRVE